MTKNRRDTDELPVPPEPAHPDGRDLWEWETKYKAALPQIWCEARLLGTYLAVFGTLTLAALAFAQDLAFPFGASKDKLILFIARRDLLVFLIGSVGGVTFAIKWLVHSVANGLWHQDRLLWRVFVPLTGGIYALVVLGLIGAGFMGGGGEVGKPSLTRDLVLAFLAGYFADGVSGLLTNIANAIFGKVDQKKNA